MYPLGYSMHSTHCFAHFAVLSFEIFFWKLSAGLWTEANFSCPSDLPFSLAQEQNLQAPVNQTWVFFPALMAT